jgi:beta-galactosidase
MMVCPAYRDLPYKPRTMPRNHTSGLPWVTVSITCFLLSLFCTVPYAQNNPRVVTRLQNGWLFMGKEVPAAASAGIDESGWEKISVPHDWAIKGPFNVENDQQAIQLLEEGDKKAMKRSGRTGGLPYAGIGWYRKHIFIPAADQGQSFDLVFDGAMSHAKVYVNNQFAGEWPYGYASFRFPISHLLHPGKDNVIAVRLENKVQSARWYPGAGIYRNVWLVKNNPVHIAHWGSFITTPEVSADRAKVQLRISIDTGKGLKKDMVLETHIYDPAHKEVAVAADKKLLAPEQEQQFIVEKPKRWSADHPDLYTAVTIIKQGSRILDRYTTVFGIRSIRFTTDKGMLVNDQVEKLKGVCLHDDLGALGMAVNKSAWRYRFQMLKDMGCNAIRGSHNPHAPEILELCDEMGFYFIDEAFDEWKSGKLENGYHTLFDQWAKADLTAMILRDRNHPALIMYSIGNEIREQNEKQGAQTARYLTGICHALDPTRPVTAGFNNLGPAIENGLADAVDIPGWNYKPDQYAGLHKKHPNWVIYGSETVSTVSSRGVYQLPVQMAAMKQWPDNQSSAYDVEYCSWSQLPDKEWERQEQDFVAGEFVWTGFDYLGEPTPYSDNWPSRSSYFGIIDLANLPKDRYYLYKSRWTNSKVLHILPHWNWEGHEGQQVPVFAYTNYPSAELFINGKSFGRKSFSTDHLLNKYRLRWENAVYQPGEMKVVAYDANGKIAETKIIRTAGKPAALRLEPSHRKLKANGEDMSFVNVSVIDKDGNLCPLATNRIRFAVSGQGTLRAVDNGNAASLEPFESNERMAFSGKCVAMIQSSTKEGDIVIKASGEGLTSATLIISSNR